MCVLNGVPGVPVFRITYYSFITIC